MTFLMRGPFFVAFQSAFEESEAYSKIVKALAFQLDA